MSVNFLLDAGTEVQDFIICAKKVSKERIVELKKEYDKFRSEERIKMGTTEDYNLKKMEEFENTTLKFNQDIAFHEKLIKQANKILGMPDD